MNYLDLQKNFEKYKPAIKLDKIISREVRYTIKMLFLYANLIMFSYFIVSMFYSVPEIDFVKGILMTCSGIFLFLFCIDAFYYDLYFNDLPIILTEPHFKDPEMSGMFIVSEIINDTEESDAVIRLLSSSRGKKLMKRLNIPIEDTDSFILNKQTKILLPSIEIQNISDDNFFENYLISLYNSDKDFHDFLFTYSIKEKELLGTSRWIVKKYEVEKRDLRWWGRDNLRKIESIGKDWSYGRAFALEKYADKIEKLYDFSSNRLGHHDKEISLIESVLTRGNEENVMLVSGDEIQKNDLLVELSKKIYGDRIPLLKNKIVFILDINDVIIGKKTKVEFEKEIINIFESANQAGNIILCIKDFPRSIKNSKTLDSDLLGLIIPYLNLDTLKIITLCDTNSFHESIEVNVTIMEKFEVIKLTEDSEENLIYNLENKTDYFEKIYRIFFTFESLEAIAQSASRYYMGQNVSDKSSDILSELPKFVLKNGKKVITKKDVLDLIQIKTGIPVGEIKQDEKDKLLNLENILHEKIISQNEAISAIGSTMRRSRSGIESEVRPMGSFLFLGPTGVGKTETTKALSEVFFGSDKKIIRLDMSEYSAKDSLSKLIGSFESGKQGVLSSLLRENQYGILLLDEFEKANGEIHNLFLQILDEGIFSDMTGQKVNARNLIIIATSNAGSNIIWDYVKQNRNLAENKQNIIDEIIKQGVFRPELINRFDGVILFHPLSNDDLKKVAIIMLKRLSKRLEEKSLELTITDELINYLVEKGSDPVFGARPINRAIQDGVEEIIARKLISGEIKPGSKVVLSRDELNTINSR